MVDFTKNKPCMNYVQSALQQKFSKTEEIYYNFNGLVNDLFSQKQKNSYYKVFYAQS